MRVLSVATRDVNCVTSSKCLAGIDVCVFCVNWSCSSGKTTALNAGRCLLYLKQQHESPPAPLEVALLCGYSEDKARTALLGCVPFTCGVFVKFRAKGNRRTF